MPERYDHTKRAIDVIGSVLLLILFGPVILLVALAALVLQGQPVIFRQDRLTKDARVFRIYKFRTMTPDAEAETGAVFAAAGDPRITPLGRLLRFTRLDELPQLLNVLKGEMSLIGPRPERPEFSEDLSRRLPSFPKRLQVKAGLTGLAQVETGYSGSVESYRRKLALDLLYIRKRSLLLDLSITLRTVVVMLTGRGAR